MTRPTMAALAVLALALMMVTDAHGQIKTRETRVTVDSLKGDTTITNSEIISESEDITPRTSMIVVNPLKFFVFYNISYFHKISPGVVIGGGIQAPTVSGVDGFGFGAEVRLHPSLKALRGFYIAPNISYNELSSGDDEWSPLSVGFLMGWQWFPGDEFAMGLGIGIDYYSDMADGSGDFQEYDGLAPAVRFDIGYAW